MEALTQEKSSIVDLFQRVVTGYVQPLRDFAHYLGSHPSAKTERESQRLALQLGTRASNAMAGAVCLNQSKYLQYYFLSAELHRQLRKETAKNSIDPSALEQNARELVEYMNEAFYEIAQSNFGLLQSYFEGRASTPPRICLKGNFRYGKSDTVITIFRDKPVHYASNVEIGRNSGFAHVHETGQYFLQNDLLEAAAKDKYFNPRLDNDRVKALRMHGRISQRDWQSCWDGADGAAAAYRSTLIVPLTLWNSDLDDRFKSKVRISDIGRTIFGYLCLDHSEPGFFDQKHDVSLGYVIADFLSMYLFVRTINIDVSKTFTKAEKLLASLGRVPHVGKLSESHVPPKVTPPSLKGLRSPIRRSKNNELFQLDLDLVRYVGAANEESDFKQDATAPFRSRT